MISGHPILLAFGTIVLVFIIRFFYALHWNRSLYKGKHGPPHSYVWGSLLALNEVAQTQPKRAAPQTIPLLIKEKYNLKDYFYMDPWPFGPAIMVILDTDMMQEFTVKASLPKHDTVEDFVQHIGGPGNLVSAEGAVWKKWRAAFNPGFSNAHLMTLVPLIVDQGLIYTDILTQKAKTNELFRMEPITTRLTVDIIGKVVLDVDLCSQTGSNELVDTLLNQIAWFPVDGGINFGRLDPRRPFVRAYNTWKMNRIIGRMLDDRFASIADRGRTKCIVDLALAAYLKENNIKEHAAGAKLDADFKEAAISNMKVFLFAGHDTTSSTICYAVYYLSKYPECMARLVKEHNEVLGLDGSPRAIGERLKDDPHLLNKLEYTSAVVREALRLQPPASTVRIGQKGFFLRDPETGEPLATENFMLWPVDVGIGRTSKYWDDGHTFKPERYLDADDHNKDAWIPFSKGVRNCIGQELALMEVKIILAMTMRAFDFQARYDELDMLKNDGTVYPSDSDGVQTQFGEEAYQVQVGSAKPREGMPCRVAMRN